MAKLVGYKGNLKIKPAGVKHRLDKHKIEEIKRCKDDLIYFLRNYVKIRNVDHGTIPFNMFDFQEEMVNLINEERFTIITCARQIGKTTCVMAYICWYAIFHAKKNIAILANKGSTAYGIMRKFKEIYENLPRWIQQGVHEWNKSSVQFENGTLVYTSATSENAVRGDSISLCMIDEAAFVEDNVWQEFWDATLPTISSGESTKLVLISTPNGMNHYYDFYTKAHLPPEEGSDEKSANGFVAFDVPWFRHPTRDEKWKESQINKTSYSRFLQEHELQFLGSDNTLIEVAALTTIDVAKPIDVRWNESFIIYEKPHPAKQYVATVDVAQGVGLDYSVITIIDISIKGRYKQVAMFRSNAINHTLFPDIIYRVCGYYNFPWLIIENNDMGAMVAHAMNDDFQYDNLYGADTFDDQGGKLNVGIKTTKRTKRMGCNNLKLIIENFKLEIVDQTTVRELSNFAKTKSGKSYAAASGTDDIVMTLVLFAWALKQQNFIEMSGMDLIGDIDALQLQELEDNDESYTIYHSSDFEHYDDTGLGY